MGLTRQDRVLEAACKERDHADKERVFNDLLAASERLLSLSERQFDQSATLDGLENVAVLADMRAAIAKAKGGA